jgi:hypothetical protein
MFDGRLGTQESCFVNDDEGGCDGGNAVAAADNTSVQLFIIYVPTEQLQGQLQIMIAIIIIIIITDIIRPIKVTTDKES